MWYYKIDKCDVKETDATYGGVEIEEKGIMPSYACCLSWTANWTPVFKTEMVMCSD